MGRSDISSVMLVQNTRLYTQKLHYLSLRFFINHVLFVLSPHGAILLSDTIPTYIALIYYAFLVIINNNSSPCIKNQELK